VGALIVYDITSRQSFLNCERWLAEMRENAGDKIGACGERRGGGFACVAMHPHTSPSFPVCAQW